MASRAYDLIIVGGGLAGAALARVMAEDGHAVLVLERETRMKDRVRGELMWPWGTAELMTLGLYDTVMESGGHKVPWVDVYRGETRTVHRDLSTTTRPKLHSTTFYHPQMQEALISAAEATGADVRRGARVREITPGPSPVVAAEIDGRQSEMRARIVVGADGRSSSVRRLGGFEVRRDPDQTMVAGVLFDDMPVADDAAHTFAYAKLGISALLFPQGQGRVRSYVCYPAAGNVRLSGKRDIPRFIEEACKTGVPEGYFADAKVAGPLATFSGAHSWVDHPYRDGVALVGDAAATSDPTHGQGLSKAVRDARALRDELRAREDWDEAGHAYAVEHDRYYGNNHTFESWRTRLLFEIGADAEARRAKAFATWPEDPTMQQEPLFSGPDQVIDEAFRRRFFGED